jgi:DNA-binding GntR family transcriptional regulator
MKKKITVYQKLKKGIIDGKLVPGLPINEYEFAKKFKVSKTPVREALLQLKGRVC